MSIILGTSGDDILSGTVDDDILEGLDGHDSLFGAEGNDGLEGGDGNDLLDGGAGDDVMTGGQGDDVYIVDSWGDLTNENAGEGTDRIETTLGWSLGAHIENLTLIGSDNVWGYGNDLNNIIIGNAGWNSLSGGDGDDTLSGGDGDDNLWGNQGDDSLSGGEGQDFLDGAEGADQMAGGAGNDNYNVDDLGDQVVELADEGYDQVNATVSWTLGANLENLSLQGTAIAGTGNELDNGIWGNDENNTLDGGDGNDSLGGHLGDDTLVGAAGDDNLSGGTGQDILSGGDGRDYLDGGEGADQMAGGNGDDNYNVDDLGDEVVELADEGYDQVNASVSWTLGAHIESLSLQGTAVEGIGNDLSNNIWGNDENNRLEGRGGNDYIGGNLGDDTLLGGDGDDWLDGGDGDDVIEGGAGADGLRGGAGADLLTGGLGDDQYEIQDLDDTIVELGGEGHDSVYSTVDYTLGDNLEMLILGGGAVFGIGNALNNVLIGTEQANVLRGLGGNDVMVASGGGDTLDGGDGEDIVFYGNLPGGSTIDLEAGVATYEGGSDDLVSLEHAIGSSDADVIYGSNFGNILYGGQGHDQLYGGAGDDHLVGESGADLLDGGDGSDTIDYSGTTERIAALVIDASGYPVSEGAFGIHADLATGWVTDTSGQRDRLISIENVTGSIHNDVIIGDGAVNILQGREGDDLLVGGAGADTIDGGAGDDAVDYGLSVMGVTIDLETGDTAGGDAEGDVLVSIESVTGSSQNDTLSAASSGSRLFGGMGDDLLTGGAGDDFLVGQEGADRLSGGDGNDRIEFGAEDILVSGGAGYDTGVVTSGTRTVINLDTASLEYIIDTAGGDDWFQGTTRTDAITVFAGGGLDVAQGGSANDTLWGEAGDDTLVGNAGDDVLVGGTGADTLAGGLGRDQLYGGAADGAQDLFRFTASGIGAANWDYVRQFEVGTDKIDLRAVSGSNFGAVTINVVGDNSQVFLTGQQVATVIGVTTLTEADFLFAPLAMPDLPGEKEAQPLIRPTTIEGDTLDISGVSGSDGRGVMAGLRDEQSLDQVGDDGWLY